MGEVTREEGTDSTQGNGGWPEFILSLTIYELIEMGYDGAIGELDAEGAAELCNRPRISTAAARRAYGADVPEGFHIHHICENRRCGKREHLVAVSQEDHVKLHRKETFCGR